MSADEQVRLEAELAKQLLAATDDERSRLYGEAYDRIYAMSLARAGSAIEDQTFGASPAHLPLLRHVAPPIGRVLEVGCGTGMLTVALADLGYTATGVDVSRVAVGRAVEHAQGRAEFLTTEGIVLPFADGSFDFAFSVETVEHLHERDALPHLREVQRVLRPGGNYMVSTPNGRYGVGVEGRWGQAADADVHLREWTFAELGRLMTEAGFEKPRYLWRIPKLHRIVSAPIRVAGLLERLVTSRRAAVYFDVHHCKVFATKP